MYQALYREYRPEVFSQVLGQSHIIQILDHQVKAGETGHAYLFCGTRGTGKTTMARILAKGVNCTGEGDKPCGMCPSCNGIKAGSFMDLIEIDAASNNGVENIRELRESVQYPPSQGKKKVYIIDEVHMLSNSAFNALLKTLEEPPESVMFILATTEPERLPATVLSRCMRMDFHRVAEPILTKGFMDICKDKDIEADLEAIQLIVAGADGSVRDGLTLLDRCISTGKSKLTREDVLQYLGAVSMDTYMDLTQAVIDGDPSLGLMTISQLIEDGKDARQILQGWMSHYRNLLMIKFLKDPGGVLNMSIENIKRLEPQAESMTVDEINRGIMEIANTIPLARSSYQPRVILEITMVKLATEEVGSQAIAPMVTRAKAKANINVGEDRLNSSPKQNLVKAQGEQVQSIKEDISSELDDRPTEEVKVDQPDKVTEVAKEAEGKGLSTPELNQIWEGILRDGESDKGGMFSLVRNSAEPLYISDKELVILSSGMTKLFIEKNITYMEDLLEKNGGHRRMIKVTDQREKVEVEAPKESSLAAQIQTTLGLKVEVK